jgi:hypothetical protein
MSIILDHDTTWSYETIWLEFDYEDLAFGKITFSNGSIVQMRAIVDDFGVVDGRATEKLILDTQVDHNRMHSKLAASLESTVDDTGRQLFTPLRDNMYCRGVLQRYDHSIATGSDSVQELIDEVRASFPEYSDSDFKCCPADFIGRYTAYRAPYNNPGISWYCLDSDMQDRINTEFNVSRLKNAEPEAFGLANGFRYGGIKFDCVDNIKTYKAAIPNYKPNLIPVLPKHAEGGMWGVTIRNDSDKTINSVIDRYFLSNDSDIGDYCTQFGLDYPTPSDIDTTQYPPWIYGITYDHTDSAFSPIDIKSYISKKLFD